MRRNTVLHYGKDGALTARTRTTPKPRCLHLRRSALVHVNTLLLQQVLAEPRDGAA